MGVTGVGAIAVCYRVYMLGVADPATPDVTVFGYIFMVHGFVGFLILMAVYIRSWGIYR